jgi:hypothetical protein
MLTEGRLKFVFLLEQITALNYIKHFELSLFGDETVT